jgi:hypothetical protein
MKNGPLLSIPKLNGNVPALAGVPIVAVTPTAIVAATISDLIFFNMSITLQRALCQKPAAKHIQFYMFGEHTPKTGLEVGIGKQRERNPI